jgi:regulator of replication initiation timing
MNNLEELQKENDELKMRLFGSRMEIRKLKLELEKVKNSLKQQQEDNTTTTDGDNQRQHTPTIHYQPDDNSTGGGGG